ncbi:division/cell wall cluster transcriptional repressor MraZ [Hyphomonas johnsonii]|uniref:Transcriptional regulator MraZ n=1 Tax=Hyphomonas johnsonii MHS-2 TaxID=1280950 RepID=A0A059FQF1_9PROT|nr:division/cell wall cluster transcriptional repressor MraZ [Hyphomonas johnsonii]KCZ92746.1 putative MraZ protein [Hyphomonas johnsonii MHS-2]
MFVSTYESAIDAKGRVSIPAPFRAALGGGTRIFLWQALDGSGCLEGGGDALMAMYRATLTRLAPQSEVRKALVNRIIAGSADLKMDETGRIKLPENLCKAAELTDRIKFAGNMDSFQIWNPEKHAAFNAAMEAAAAAPETLEAFGRAYSEVLHQQGVGNYMGPKLVEGGEG